MFGGGNFIDDRGRLSGGFWGVGRLGNWGWMGFMGLIGNDSCEGVWGRVDLYSQVWQWI